MHVPCKCDCGTEDVILAQTLRRKDRSNPSCGCWKRERASRDAIARWTKHGQSRVPGNGLYLLWKMINRRCHNPAADNYRYYGGRGIKVCEQWRENAGAFIAYVERELGPRPADRTAGGAWEYTIDRIDNNGNYEPGNVRWATRSQQVRNRRAARLP
jgi:Staphylococcus phage HNH endonuclease